MITRKRSLKIYCALFLVWMLMVGYRKFKDIYILMKHSVVDINVPGIVLYVVELCAYLAIAILLSKIVKNIQNQVIFDRSNVRMFRGMAFAVSIPILAHGISTVLTDTATYIVGYSMGTGIGYWVTAYLFLIIITEIFRYGMLLKEEQDLTV